MFDSGVCEINAHPDGRLNVTCDPPRPPKFNVGPERLANCAEMGVFFAAPKRPPCHKINIELGVRGCKIDVWTDVNGRFFRRHRLPAKGSCVHGKLPPRKKPRCATRATQHHTPEHHTQCHGACNFRSAPLAPNKRNCYAAESTLTTQGAQSQDRGEFNARGKEHPYNPGCSKPRPRRVQRAPPGNCALLGGFTTRDTQRPVELTSSSFPQP